ncbi:MAG: sulfatase-like hydrolase/transferase, partial [Bacteroidales bacterium]|nr:sulfatase-like hydrolase/transferase [Bacteroidales bacterium]
MRKNNPLIQNLFLIVKEYGFWILMFAIQKPIFLCLNYEKGTSFLDFLQVIWHGLKLDFCTSAYFCFIPIIICLVNGLKTLPINKILRIYNIVLGVLISIIFAVDCVLFSYWGFHLDATLIFYLNDTKDATNSVTFFDVVRFVLILVPYLLLLLFINNKIFSNIEIVFQKVKAKVVNALVLLILLPVFFVFTRGGVSTATANVGMVYYSQNQLLNLSAINPTFSLMYSMTKREDFSKEYIYMDTEECKTLFDDLYYVEKDTTINVLNTQNPNIVIILWESLSANAVGGVGGENSTVDNKEITPGLNQLTKEGIVFSNCYANAMRTDRGIVSVLTGFLAQPTTSIIKYPNKTRSLPTLARVLSYKGYSTSMLYGGDINFANMRSYFISSGYQDIVSDSDFPIKQKLSKWGVNDEITFDYLFKDIKQQPSDKKFFKTFLTLSSHEPFDVNMHRFKDPYVNSIAYTDSC